MAFGEIFYANYLDNTPKKNPRIYASREVDKTSNAHTS